MQHHIINCFDTAQLGLELEKIGLKHFHLHIVHVILDELVHPVA